MKYKVVRAAFHDADYLLNDLARQGWTLHTARITSEGQLLCVMEKRL